MVNYITRQYFTQDYPILTSTHIDVIYELAKLFNYKNVKIYLY